MLVEHPYYNTIPRRLLQTWKSKTDLPANYAYWRSTFIEKNPDFTHDLWDDTDNRNFIVENFDWFLPIYDHYPAEIYRVDAVRYFYLYMFGGVYADLDTECLQPLELIVDARGVVLGKMGSNKDLAHGIPNAIMASRPREEFWILVIALMTQLAHLKGSPEQLTGPILLKSAVHLYQSGDPSFVPMMIQSFAKKFAPNLMPRQSRTDILLLPQRRWYPLDWSDPIHQRLRKSIINGEYLDEDSKKELFGDSWLVTYWTHSW